MRLNGQVKKYFVAIVIPEPLFNKIEAIKQALFEENGLKGALRSPSHITLHRPFEWKEEKETTLIDTLKRFDFKTSFTISLKDFAFFAPRVIYVDVLPNAALTELHDQLKNFAKRELKLFNEAEDMRGFHPHVTIAFRDLKKPLFYELQKAFDSQQIEGAFECAHFHLLKLEQRWEILETFSFSKRDQNI